MKIENINNLHQNWWSHTWRADHPEIFIESKASSVPFTRSPKIKKKLTGISAVVDLHANLIEQQLSSLIQRVTRFIQPHAQPMGDWIPWYKRTYYTHIKHEAEWNTGLDWEHAHCTKFMIKLLIKKMNLVVDILPNIRFYQLMFQQSHSLFNSDLSSINSSVNIIYIRNAFQHNDIMLTLTKL